jgi:hypothetical protein
VLFESDFADALSALFDEEHQLMRGVSALIERRLIDLCTDANGDARRVPTDDVGLLRTCSEHTRARANDPDPNQTEQRRSQVRGGAEPIGGAQGWAGHAPSRETDCDSRDGSGPVSAYCTGAVVLEPTDSTTTVTPLDGSPLIVADPPVG